MDASSLRFKVDGHILGEGVALAGGRLAANAIPDKEAFPIFCLILLGVPLLSSEFRFRFDVVVDVIGTILLYSLLAVFFSLILS